MCDIILQHVPKIKELTEGKTKWHTSTVSKILRNEKYIGDALLQKTYTTDFLTKKRIKRLITKITVFEDHFAIDFKSGITIEIAA